MKEIIDYINNNAIVASLLTLILTTIIQILFRRSDRRYNEKKESKDKHHIEFQNKAELLIDDNIKNDDGTVPHINLFMTDFDVKVLKEENTVNFYYSKDVLNSKKYKHLVFYIKNIGNADIQQLDICSSFQKSVMLCDIDSLKSFVNNNFVNYSHCFDRKIMKNNYIMIDIAYLEDSKICGMFSSELVLLYRDSYNNLYKQPFFIQQRNLYEPKSISYKDYLIYTTVDLAIECFKKPWMW